MTCAPQALRESVHTVNSGKVYAELGEIKRLSFITHLTKKSCNFVTDEWYTEERKGIRTVLITHS